MPDQSRHSVFLSLICVFAAGLSGSNAFADGVLIEKSNLEYLGIFYLPDVSERGFSYGGSAITFNPTANSLFVVGHVSEQETAEVTIPSIGGTANIIQSLTDSLAGQRNAVGTGPDGTRIGGNLVFNGRLYITAFIYYDTARSQVLSHFSRPLDLQSDQLDGPFRVGSLGAGFYSGYMGIIPASWQSRLGGPALTGNCCLSILTRSSYGPAAFAFDPESLGDAIPLVYYTSDHQTLGEYSAPGSNPDFNGTTRITGIVFPEGTDSVLFFGTTGIGDYCYGDAEPCGDLATIYKGEHAYPYRAYVWAYDANDLARVRSGSMQPWEVVPYSTWELGEWGDTTNDFASGGAAYDPDTGRVYVAQPGGTAKIHVYQIELPPRPLPPADVTAD